MAIDDPYDPRNESYEDDTLASLDDLDNEEQRAPAPAPAQIEPVQEQAPTSDSLVSDDEHWRQYFEGIQKEPEQLMPTPEGQGKGLTGIIDDVTKGVKKSGESVENKGILGDLWNPIKEFDPVTEKEIRKPSDTPAGRIAAKKQQVEELQRSFASYVDKTDDPEGFYGTVQGVFDYLYHEGTNVWLPWSSTENRIKKEKQLLELLEKGKLEGAGRLSAGQHYTNTVANAVVGSIGGGIVEGVGQVAGALGWAVGADGRSFQEAIDDNAITATARLIKAQSEAMFPGNPEKQAEFNTMAAAGFGSMIGFVAGNSAPLAFKGVRKLAIEAMTNPDAARKLKWIMTLSTGFLGSMVGVSESTGDVKQSALAGRDVSEGQLIGAMFVGIIAGSSETFNINYSIPGMSNWKNWAARTIREAIEEGGQEGFQSLLNGIWAKYGDVTGITGIKGHDPARELGEEVLESLGIGVIVGGGTQAGKSALSGEIYADAKNRIQIAKARIQGRTRTDADQPAPPQPQQQQPQQQAPQGEQEQPAPEVPPWMPETIEPVEQAPEFSPYATPRGGGAPVPEYVDIIRELPKIEDGPEQGEPDITGYLQDVKNKYFQGRPFHELSDQERIALYDHVTNVQKLPEPQPVEQGVIGGTPLSQGALSQIRTQRREALVTEFAETFTGGNRQEAEPFADSVISYLDDRGLRMTPSGANTIQVTDRTGRTVDVELDDTFDVFDAVQGGRPDAAQKKFDALLQAKGLDVYSQGELAARQPDLFAGQNVPGQPGIGPQGAPTPQQIVIPQDLIDQAADLMRDGAIATDLPEALGLPKEAHGPLFDALKNQGFIWYDRNLVPRKSANLTAGATERPPVDGDGVREELDDMARDAVSGIQPKGEIDVSPEAVRAIGERINQFTNKELVDVFDKYVSMTSLTERVDLVEAAIRGVLTKAAFVEGRNGSISRKTRDTIEVVATDLLLDRPFVATAARLEVERVKDAVAETVETIERNYDDPIDGAPTVFDRVRDELAKGFRWERSGEETLAGAADIAEAVVEEIASPRERSDAHVFAPSEEELKRENVVATYARALEKATKDAKYSYNVLSLMKVHSGPVKPGTPAILLKKQLDELLKGLDGDAKPDRTKAKVVEQIEELVTARAAMAQGEAATAGEITSITRDLEDNANERRRAAKGRRDRAVSRVIREGERAVSEGVVSAGVGTDGESRDARGTSGDDRGTSGGTVSDDSGESAQGNERGSLAEAGDVSGTGERNELDSGDGRGSGESGDTATDAGKRGVEESREARAARESNNYRITDEDKIGAGGDKTKVRQNIAAIRILKQIEEEGREATPDEKKALVKYVGWGAYSQPVFAPNYTNKKDWEKEREELRNLLDAKEYSSAEESTLNAHYTSKEIIDGIWGAVSHLGYKGGTALEPAGGIGHFIGLQPKESANSTNWHLIELDDITARIARVLYGDSTVRSQGFETTKYPDNFFDLAISNVPFGGFKLTDDKYKDFLIHDYFFVKSLDKVRPGGIVAFVTSSGTMDKPNNAARLAMKERADFVGAIRLPATAFKANAGTDVTTDIIFLRKRPEGAAPLPSASEFQELVEVKTPEGPTKINEYFAANPHMMLGKMRLTGSRYGPGQPQLVGPINRLNERIAEVAQYLPANVMTDRATSTGAVNLEDLADETLKEGALFVKGGKLHRNMAGVGEPLKAGKAIVDRIKPLLAIRDSINTLLARQVTGDLEGIDAVRAKLNKDYDDFVKKYGPINKSVKSKNGAVRRPNLEVFTLDPDAFKIAAIELYNDDSGESKKTAIFEKSVIDDYKRPAVSSAFDALTVSLNEYGRIDIVQIASMIGKTEAETIAELGDRVFMDPDGQKWVLDDIYLSGDVVGKLEAARELAEIDPSYQRNVDALQAVQPPPLTRLDIYTTMGAPWIPLDIYNEFIGKVLNGRRAEVEQDPITKRWQFRIPRKEVHFPSSTDFAYGVTVPRRDGSSEVIVDVKTLLIDVLNQKPTRIYKSVANPNGGEPIRIVDEELTTLAAQKQKELKELFEGDKDAGIEGWIFEDEDRAQRIEAIYNHQYNRLVPTIYNGEHQQFPGIASKLTLDNGMQVDFKLRPHQSNAVWRAVNEGNILLDHAVGSGKTFTAIAALHEQKRLGLIKRPMVVVPNHMIEQWAREWYQAYPNAKLLVADGKNMSAKNRQRFFGQIASQEWDGIIITHSAFGRVPLGPESLKIHIEEEIANYRAALAKEGADEETKSRDITVKNLQSGIKKLKERLKTAFDKAKKDKSMTFEEMGIDYIAVDEAHMFKNLEFATRHSNVKGIKSDGSIRSLDLYSKIKYLERQRPGRSALFMTGTPVSNTIAELYTMQRYLQGKELKAYGIDSFDNWAATFGKVVTKQEWGPDGRTLQEATSFSKFVNIPELVNIYSKVADVQTMETLKLKRPDLKNGVPTIIESELSEWELAKVDELVERADAIKSGKVDRENDNMLNITTEGRKVALDGRLLDGRQPPNPNGKIANAADNIARIYKEGKEPALGQIVFMDMGVPSTNRKTGNTTNLYKELTDLLVKKGVPRDEIAWIYDADTDDKKGKLFDKVKKGEVRILMGSRGKMGVGTNVQTRLIAAHHIDPPWRPSDIEQSNGRILRQGNMNPEVEIFHYISKKSFDTYMWQKIEEKASGITQLRSGARGVRTIEDIDEVLPEAADLKAAASGDPRIMRHAKLTKQIRELEALKRGFERAFIAARQKYASLEKEVAVTKEKLVAYEVDSAKVTDTKGKAFKARMDLGRFTGEKTDRKKVGEAIKKHVLESLENSWHGRPQEFEFGNLSGFKMVARARNNGNAIEITYGLEGAATYSTGTINYLNEKTDGSNITQFFERVLRSIPAMETAARDKVSAYTMDMQRIAPQTEAKEWPRSKELGDAKVELEQIEQEFRDDAEKAKKDKLAEQAPSEENAELIEGFGDTMSALRNPQKAKAALAQAVSRRIDNEQTADQSRRDFTNGALSASGRADSEGGSVAGGRSGTARAGERSEAGARAGQGTEIARAVQRLLPSWVKPEALARRANDQGFSVEGYHASKDGKLTRVNAFRTGSAFGFHFSVGSPAGANARIGYPTTLIDKIYQTLMGLGGTSRRDPSAPSFVMPVRARANSPLRMPHVTALGYGHWHEPMAWMAATKHPEYNGPAGLKAFVARWIATYGDKPRGHEFSEAIATELEKYGYDSVIYRDTAQGVGQDSMFVWDDRSVRSAYDYFHPAAAGVAGLNASDEFVAAELEDRISRIEEQDGIREPSQEIYSFSDMFPEADTAQMLIGPKAAAFDHVKVSEAEDMETAGASREDIWEATGTFRLPSGQWAQELSDRDFKLIEGEENVPVSFTTAFQHPLADQMYPEQFKEYQFQSMPNDGSQDYGAFAPSPYNRVMVQRYDEFKDFDWTDLNEGKPLTAEWKAIHETQHLVAHIEGWQPGGNRGSMLRDANDQQRKAASKALAAWNQSLEDLRKLEVKEKALLKFKPTDLDQAMQKLLEARTNLQAVAAVRYAQWQASFDQDVKEPSQEEAYDYYHRLEGEVLARAVQKRLTLTDEERKARPPWLDYDVPESNMIQRVIDEALVSEIEVALGTRKIVGILDGSNHKITPKAFHYVIELDDGGLIDLFGNVRGELATFDQIYSRFQEGKEGYFEYTNQVGVPTMRNLLKLMKKDFPQIKRVGGNRISGARSQWYGYRKTRQNFNLPSSWSNDADVMASLAPQMSKEARLQRLRDMGFDTSKVWYRGVGNELSSRGITWFAESQDRAGDYAEFRLQQGAAASIIPAYLRSRTPFDAEKMRYATGQRTSAFSVKSLFDEIKDQANDRLSAQDIQRLDQLEETVAAASRREESGPRFSRHDFWYDTKSKFGADGASALDEAFRIGGFDSIRDTEAGRDTIGIFDPTNIRSVNAEADPAKSDSADIMAGLAAEQIARDRERREFFSEQEKLGSEAYSALYRRQESVVTPPEVVESINSHLRRYTHMLPAGISFGTVTRIDPEPGLTTAIVTIRSVFGTTSKTSIPLRSVRELDHFFVPNTGTIVLNRFGIAPEIDAILGSDAAFELARVIVPRLPSRIRSRLLSHAASLGIGEMELGEYLSRIGHHKATKAAPGTLREFYTKKLRGAKDQKEKVDTYIVAHLFQMVNLGVFSPDKTAPIQPILDQLNAGELTGRGKPKADADAMLALTEDQARILKEVADDPTYNIVRSTNNDQGTKNSDSGGTGRGLSARDADDSAAGLARRILRAFRLTRSGDKGKSVSPNTRSRSGSPADREADVRSQKEEFLILHYNKARDIGYDLDVVWYQGAPNAELKNNRYSLAYASPDNLIGPGLYMTENPYVAGGNADMPLLYNPYGYAGDFNPQTRVGKWGKAPGVRKLVTRVKNPFDIDNMRIPVSAMPERVRSYYVGYEDATLEYFEAAELIDKVTQIKVDTPPAKTILRDILEGLGYDAITMIGGGRYVDGSKKHRVMVVFRPNKVRSWFADFDPDQVESADMNAALKPRTLEERYRDAYAVMQSDEWKASTSDVTDDMRTSNQPGFMSPEWKEARTYETETGPLTGYDNAIDYELAKQREKAGEVKKERKVFIVMGMSGSGKSSISEELIKQRGALHIVSDNFKPMIPEYDGGRNSVGVHGESSWMSADAVAKSIADGSNIILETTASRIEALQKTVESMKAAGYEIYPVYVDIHPAIAMERAVNRWRETGRSVPMTTYIGNVARESFDKVTNFGGINETGVIRWDEETQDWINDSTGNELSDLTVRNPFKQRGLAGLDGADGSGRIGESPAFFEGKEIRLEPAEVGLPIKGLQRKHHSGGYMRMRAEGKEAVVKGKLSSDQYFIVHGDKNIGRVVVTKGDDENVTWIEGIEIDDKDYEGKSTRLIRALREAYRKVDPLAKTFAGRRISGSRRINNAASNLQTVTMPRLAESGARTAFNEEFVAILPAIRAEIMGKIRKMVPEDVAVRLDQRLFDGNKETYGRFRPSKRLLEVAMAYGPEKAIQIAGHEVVHVLRNADLFTEEEWTALLERGRKLVEAKELEFSPGNSIRSVYEPYYLEKARLMNMSREQARAYAAEMVDQEIVAKMAEGYFAKRSSYGSRINTLLQRIMDVLSAISEALTGRGFNQADSIFRRMERGEIAARPEPKSQPPKKTSREELILNDPMTDEIRAVWSDELYTPRGDDRPFVMEGFDTTVSTKDMPDGLVTSTYHISQDGQPVASAVIQTNLDNGWDLKALRINKDIVAEPHELAIGIIDAIKRDAVGPQGPDGWLTEDDYNFWKTTEPDYVRNHVPVGHTLYRMYVPAQDLDDMRTILRDVANNSDSPLLNQEIKQQLYEIDLARELIPDSVFEEMLATKRLDDAYALTPPGQNPDPLSHGPGRRIPKFGNGSNRQNNDDLDYSLTDLVHMLTDALGTEARHGRINPGLKAAMGRLGAQVWAHFSSKTGLARLVIPNDIDALGHEAGHALESSPRLRGYVQAIKHHFAAELAPLASPGKNALSEGWSEYVRLYLTQPRMIKKLTGLNQAFEAMLEANDPDMLQAFQTISTGYQTLVDAGPNEFLASRLRSTTMPTGLIGQIGHHVKQVGLYPTVTDGLEIMAKTIADKNHPMKILTKRLVQATIENKEIKLQPNEAAVLRHFDNPHQLMRMITQVRVHALAVLQNGVIPTGEALGKGPSMRDILAKAMGGLKRHQWNQKNFMQFNEFLVARRIVAEFARYDDGFLENPPDELMTRDKWIEALETLEKAHPEFVDAGLMLDEFMLNTLKWKYDEGFLTDEQYADFASRDGYAPLNRIRAQGAIKDPFAQRDLFGTSYSTAGGVSMGGRNTKAKMVHRFRGSTLDFIPPIESIVSDIYRTQQRVELNRVVGAIRKLAAGAGPLGGAIAEVLPAKEIKANRIDLKAALSKHAKEQGFTKEEIEDHLDELDALYDGNMSVVMFKATDIRADNERIVYHWENGKPVPIMLGTDGLGKDVYEVLTEFGNQNLELAVEIAALGTQAFRAGITKNPVYIITNWLRDQVQTWTLSRDYTPFWDGFKGLYHVVKNTDAAKRYNHWAGLSGIETNLQNEVGAGRQALELRQSGFFGAPTTWQKLMRAMEITELATRVQHMENIYQRINKETKKQKTKKQKKSPLQNTKNHYNRMRREGFTEAESAFEAALMSHDVMAFSDKGSRMMHTSRLAAFFMSQINGMRATLRTMRGERNVYHNYRDAITPYIKANEGLSLSIAEKEALPNSVRVWFKMIGVGLAGLMLKYAVHWWGDEDKKKAEEELPDEMKATHWFAPVLDTWGRVPKHFELAIFSNLFEAAFDLVVKDDPRFLEKMGTSVRQTVLIWPEYQAAEGMQIIYNTAIKGPLDAISGESRYDRNRNNNVPRHLRGLPAHEQYDYYTSELGILMGQAFGASPYLFDRAVKVLLSSNGRDLLMASDALLPAVNNMMGMAIPKVGTRTRPNKSVEDYYLLSRFTRRPSRASLSEQHFWQQMDESSGKYMQAAEAYKRKMDSATPHEGQAYLMSLSDEHRAFATLMYHFESSEKDLHPMHRAKQVIRVNNALRNQMLRENIVKMETKAKRGEPKDFEERIKLNATQMRLVNEILQEINMREARNSLIVVQHYGWKQKDLWSIDPLLVQLRGVSPEIADELQYRRENGANKVLPFEGVARNWPKVKRELLTKGADAFLGEYEADAF